MQNDNDCVELIILRTIKQVGQVAGAVMLFMAFEARAEAFKN